MKKTLLHKGLLVSVLTLAMVGFFFMGGLYTSTVEADSTAKDISVNGVGVVMAKPDIAVVNIGVETSNKDSKTAQEENTKSSNQLLETLKKLNIKEEDIKTASYNMYRERLYNTPDGKPIDGEFKVTHIYEVTIRKIDNVGSIIDTASKNGANQINGVRFTVSDSSKYYNQALKSAIGNAGGKAETIASALGVKIGKPAKVVENSYNEPIYGRYMDVKQESLANDTAISSGELEIRAQVQVTYNY